MLGVKAVARRKNNYIFAPEKQRRRGPGCLVLFLSVVLAVVVLTVLTNVSINQKMELSTARVSVMSLDKAFEGFAILQISDLHASPLGEDMAAWRELLFGKKFSAVVLCGDMVGQTGNAAPLIALIQSLHQINSAAPVFFIAGDEDPAPMLATYRGTPEVYADWVLAAQAAGGIYLDAPCRVEVGKRAVWFSPEYLYSVDIGGMQQSLTTQKLDMEAKGLQYEAEGGASYRALSAREDAMNRTAEAIKSMEKDDLQIAVTHVPLEDDYVRTAVEWAKQDNIFNFRNVSLVVAGHYVGGQWRLMNMGPLYVPDRGFLPGDEGILGLQRINSVNQSITQGLSYSGFYPMPYRLFNRPGASLLIYTARIQ